MRAIKVNEARVAVLVEREIPEPSATDVVVRVTSAGICGSDIAVLHATHPFRIPPLITGHEVGGAVAAVGEECSLVSVGDKVIIDPQRACGSCEFCLSGRYHLCSEKQMLGISEWDGALADYVKVPETCVIKAPVDIDERFLSVAEPIAVAAHAVEQILYRGPERVLILGGGTIGALILRVLKHHEVEHVDVSEPRTTTHELLRKFGVQRIFDPVEIGRSDSGGYDVVFIAAGVPDLFDAAFDVVQQGGAIVQVAVFKDKVSIPVGEIQTRELAMHGTAMYTKDDFRTALEIMVADPSIATDLVTDIESLDTAADVLNRVAQEGMGSSVKIVMVPK